MFPRMRRDELRVLGEDIKMNGLTSPFALWQADPKSPPQLLDGRNRLDAIELTIGEPLHITTWHGTVLIEDSSHLLYDTRQVEGDPYAYVISANIHRRHLTAEQKRELIAKLIKATPEKSDRQIAETVKASPTTVGTVRAKMETKGEVSKLDTRTDAKGVKQPAKKQTKPQRPPAADKPKPRDDIGPGSRGELARKDAELEELRNAKRRLENVGLRSEVEEAKSATKPAILDMLANDDDVCRVVVDCIADVITRIEKALATSIDAEQRRRLFDGLDQALADLAKGDDENAHAEVTADDGLDIPACLRRVP
jgi:hypothetical protein